MGNNQCSYRNCKQCDRRGSRFKVSKDSNMYCHDHTCAICNDLPNGFGNKRKEYCRWCACTTPDCPFPREHKEFEYCNRCWTEKMFSEADTFVQSKIDKGQKKDRTLQEKTISHVGSLNELESAITNDVAAMIRVNGISSSGFITDLCTAIASGIDGAVENTTVQESNSTRMSSYQTMNFNFHGRVACGDVVMKIQIVWYMSIQDVRIMELGSEGYKSQMNASRAASITGRNGKKIQKDSCFAACIGRMVMVSEEILPIYHQLT